MSNNKDKASLYHYCVGNMKKITYDYVMSGIAQYLGDAPDATLKRLTERAIKFYLYNDVNYDDVFYAVTKAYEEGHRLTENNIRLYMPF